MKNGWYFEATVLEDKGVQGELRGVVWMCRFERKVFPVAKRSMYSTQAQFPNREDPSQKQRCLSAIYLDTNKQIIFTDQRGFVFAKYTISLGRTGVADWLILINMSTLCTKFTFFLLKRGIPHIKIQSSSRNNQDGSKNNVVV